MSKDGIPEGQVPQEGCGSIAIQHIRCLSGPEDLDLYLNQIPIQMLRKYCGIERISIESNLNGVPDLHINRYYSDGRYESESVVLQEHSIDVDILKGDFISISKDLGVRDTDILFTVYAVPNSSREVKMAHVVCTYRKEDEAREKIELFSRFDIPGYRLFVIDNGGTIPEVSDERVTVIHSPNYGGSAGFAKGMIESLKGDYTHIILNDDDARLNPESVFRAIAFYSIIRDEYKDVCLAGINLDSGDSYVVYGSGGVFRNTQLYPLNAGKDMRRIDDIASLFA